MCLHECVADVVGEIDTIGLRYDTTGLKKVSDLFNIYYKIVHEVHDRQTYSKR